MVTPTSGEGRWLASLPQYYPQLAEKAVIDLVNGIEVIEDHLRCRAMPHPLVARLWDALTGRTSRHQYLIDINLAAGTKAVTAWLTDLQAFQTRSDLALAAVANTLAQTRDVLGTELIDLRSTLDEGLAEVRSKLEATTARVDELEMGDKAKTQLEIVALRVKRGTDRPSSVAQLFLAIDELWWGDFGRYCRRARTGESVARLIALARHKLEEAFASRPPVGIGEIITVEELLRPVASLSADEKAVLAFLAQRGVPWKTPLMHAIAAAAQPVANPEAAALCLPRAFTLSGAVVRLLRESRNATLELEQ